MGRLWVGVRGWESRRARWARERRLLRAALLSRPVARAKGFSSSSSGVFGRKEEALGGGERGSGTLVGEDDNVGFEEAIFGG